MRISKLIAGLLISSMLFGVAEAGGPTTVGLTGKDASSATQTVNTVTCGSYQCSTPLLSGWNYNGTAIDYLSSDGAHNLNINLTASSAFGTPTAPATTSVVSVQTGDAQLAPSAAVTRPANTTAYVAGYLLANSTTAGSVTPLSWTNLVRAAGYCTRIERLRITANGNSLTNASFKVFLFNSSPTVTVGDGAAFDASGVLSTSGALTLAGSFATTFSNSGSDGAVGWAVPSVGNGVTVCPTSGTTVYALIEVTAAYTPTSAEVFTVYAEGLHQ